MKKALSAIMILCLLCALLSCTQQGKVLKSIGKYDSEDFYTNGGFQDYTDYAKYRYKSVDLEDNEYFSLMNEDDIQKLNLYINNFENRVATIGDGDATNELVVNYDFDRSMIDTDDCYYIYDKMGTPIGESEYQQFDSYDVYFLDFQTNTVYYFHSNI